MPDGKFPSIRVTRMISIVIILLLLLLLLLSSYDIIISNISVFLGPFKIQINIILGSGNRAY